MGRLAFRIGLVLVLLVAVFALKVRHAESVCAELLGRWAEGECHFDERRPGQDVPLGRQPGASAAPGPEQRR